MIKLIVLDRDGVINEDSPDYIRSPDSWQPIPGSMQAIAKLKAYGYKIAVATNQSGIARGYFTLETLKAIHDKMLLEIRAALGDIDEIFICPHGPDDNCSCRKPKTGLLVQAAQKFQISPAEMLVIGDSWRDIEAARSFGANAIFVFSSGKTADKLKAEQLKIPVYNNLLLAVEDFCQHRQILNLA